VIQVTYPPARATTTSSGVEKEYVIAVGGMTMREPS